MPPVEGARLQEDLRARGEAVASATMLFCVDGKEVSEMVISSLVVETAPDCTEAVSAELDVMDGVEIHGVEGHKVVITIEAETVDDSHAIANSIGNMTGVLFVNLVYLNFEGDKTIYPDGV